MRNMRRVGQTPGLRSQGLKRQPNGGYRATPTPPAQQGGDFRMRALQDMNRPKPPSGGFQQPAGMHQQQRPQQGWQQPKAAPQQRQMQPQAQPQRQAPRQQSPGLSVYNQKPAQTKPLHQNQAGDAPLYFKALQQMAPNQNMQGRQYSSQPKQDGWDEQKQWQPAPKYSGGSGEGPPSEKQDGWGEQKQWQPAPKYSGGSGEGPPSEKQEESPFDKQDSDLFGAKAVGEDDSQPPADEQKPGYDPMKVLASAIVGSTSLDLGGYDQTGADEEPPTTMADFKQDEQDAGSKSYFDQMEAFKKAEQEPHKNSATEEQKEAFLAAMSGFGDDFKGISGPEQDAGSKTDQLWDKFMETIDSPTEVFSDEDKAAFEQMVGKQAAQGKSDMSQQMGARGMGASGLVGSGFGNIDSQAASQIQDFHIQARQMDVENELNRLKTVAQVYGQTLSEEQRMEIFEKMHALEQEKFGYDKEQQAQEDAWNGILNEMGLKGDDKLTEAEYQLAAAKWGVRYPGQPVPPFNPPAEAAQSVWQHEPPPGVSQPAWDAIKDYAEDGETHPDWAYVSDAEWAAMSPEERLDRLVSSWKASFPDQVVD